MSTDNFKKTILSRILSLLSGIIVKTTTTGNAWALKVTTENPSIASSTALAASLVVKASAGSLFTAAIYNGNVGTQYIQVHNAASLPANATVPLFTFAMATGTTQILDFNLLGLTCSTGIVLCNSSTAATKTIGANDTWFTASYR